MSDDGDVEAAIEQARYLEPWYRCQSLAHIASQLSDDYRSKSLLREALNAAWDTKEANRIVSVAAWPCEILARRAWHDELKTEFERLLLEVKKEPHSLWRLDALYSFWHFVPSAPDWLTDPLISEIMSVSQECPSWKKDRALSDIASAVALTDPAKALELANLIYVPRVRRNALKHIRDAELGLVEKVPNVSYWCLRRKQE